MVSTISLIRVYLGVKTCHFFLCFLFVFVFFSFFFFFYFFVVLHNLALYCFSTFYRFLQVLHRDKANNSLSLLLLFKCFLITCWDTDGKMHARHVIFYFAFTLEVMKLELRCYFSSTTQLD